MIEKLDEKSLTWNASDTSWVLFWRALYHKQCEIISHLNTQEEKVRGKAYHEWYADWKIYADITASNQSNTCKECKGKWVIPHYLDYKDSRQEHYCEDCDGTGIKPTTLPKKIKLLKDRAGYPAGEYTRAEENDEVLQGGNYYMYYEWTGWCLDPDIIKATSWQGIRSEVNKCSLCRKWRIENEWGVDEECPRCSHREPTTESVSTVEQETVWAWLLEWKKRKEEYISKLTTPDPYEECAKEVTREFYELSICDWNKKMAEDYVSCILKKHFPTAL